MKKVNHLLARERKRFGFLINHEESLKGYGQFLTGLNEDINRVDLVDLEERIDQTIQLLKERNNFYIEKRHGLDLELKQVKDELNDVRRTIKQLEQKKLPYRKELTRLRELIEDDLMKRYGKDISVHVLCELLEVKDEKWRNAIEGYLNTQRFDLIVEPEYFDQALRVYERHKFNKRIYGVGLVNVAKITTYREAEPNSLATKVTSDSFYATCYANMILNKVQCVETVDELKQHTCAITTTCMVYQNHTARQINEKIYKKPYIGQNAIRIQLEENKNRKTELEHVQEDLELKLKNIDLVVKNLSTDPLYELKGMIERIRDYRETSQSLQEKEKELAQIPLDETMIDLQTRLDQITGLLDLNRQEQEEK